MTIAPFSTQGSTDTTSITFRDAGNITSGASNWTFGTAGNIMLPDSGSIEAETNFSLKTTADGTIYVDNADLYMGGTSGGWVQSIDRRVDNHWSWFEYVQGTSTGESYAIGTDNYDGDIPYIAKFSAAGALEWQKQLTVDGSEGASGTGEHMALIGGIPWAAGQDFWTGNIGIWLGAIDPLTGDTFPGTVGVIHQGNGNRVTVNGLSNSAGNVVVAGYLENVSKHYNGLDALHGSAERVFGANLSVFGSNVPNASGSWYITNGAIGGSTATINQINLWPERQAEYLHGVKGGSIALNGTSQFLYTTGLALPSGTGDWTVDCWVYIEDLTFLPPAPQPYTAQLCGGNATGALQIRFISSSNVDTVASSLEVSARGGTVYTASLSLTSYTWTFLSVQRASGVVSVYLNGELQGTGSLADSLVEPTQLTIGSNEIGGEEDYFPGYITNFRIIEGVALYNGNFPTPTDPLASTVETTLLLGVMDQANALVDTGGMVVTVNSLAGAGWNPVGPFNGSGAAFNITFDNASVYTTSITNGGSGYSVGDQLVIAGNIIAGGTTPTNDLYINVTNVDAGAGNSISTFNSTGTPNYDPAVIWLTTESNFINYGEPNVPPWSVVQNLSTNGYLWTPNWAVQAASQDNNYDLFWSMDTDTNGNIYAGGYTQAIGRTQSWLTKFSKNGALQWSVTFDDDTLYNEVWGVAVDSTNNAVYAIANNNYGYGVLTKINAIDGTGIWQTRVTDVYGADTGLLVAQDGNPIVTGSGEGGAYFSGEGMVAMKFDSTDGNVLWATALTNADPRGLWNWWGWSPNNSSAIGSNRFGMAGFNYLYGGEGAFVSNLPSDGSGAGTWGQWTYTSFTPGIVQNTSATTSTVDVTVSPVDLVASPVDWYTALPRPETFVRQGINSPGGNVTNIGQLVFADGTFMDTAASGSGVGNLTVTANVITVSPETVVTFDSAVTVTDTLWVANGINTNGALSAMGNVSTDGAVVIGNGGTPKVMQIWNSITNSLDTVFL